MRAKSSKQRCPALCIDETLLAALGWHNIYRCNYRNLLHLHGLTG